MADTLRDAIDSIRNRVHAELDAQLAVLAERHAAELVAVRTASNADAERRLAEAKATSDAEAERRIAAASSAAIGPGSLVHAFGEIEAADSLSGILDAIGRAVAMVSPGASLHVGPEAVRKSSSDGPAVVPLLLDGTAVAAVTVNRSAQASTETVRAIARYGSARLSAVTAVRTAQAQRWIARSAPSLRTAGPAGPSDDSAAVDPVQGARRFARLLVSEIKLYNEANVREGREHHDISRRLAAEIERARRTYEERVPTTVPDRDRHFHQELVQTLAGGDASLLG